MSSALADIGSYSTFIYSLAERHPEVINSSLILVPIGATLAKLEGRMEYRGDLRVEVFELIDFADQGIRAYSYEVFAREQKVCWYDHWEHPEIPALSTTFPHHKHRLPDLRNNRVCRTGDQF